MPKYEDLYVALIDGDLQAALGETAILLGGDGSDFTALEDTWIAAMGAIGERMPTGLWASVGEAMLDVLSGDAMPVRDAFRTSVSIALLFRRVAAAGRRRSVREAITGLRATVAEWFPEGAALSAAGEQQFARVLTGMSQTERAFATRLLAGLCRLWAEKRTEDMRAAIEYLTRRRTLALPVLAEWSVSREEGDRGDMIWFLWAAVRVYFAGRPEMGALWNLFIWNWRRGVKTDRLGLLWGAAVAGTSAAEDWSWNAQESEILQKVTDKSAELWKELAPPARPAPSGGAGGGSDDATTPEAARMDVWLSFVPRAGAGSAKTSAAASAALEPAFKSLKLKTKGDNSESGNGSGSGRRKENETCVARMGSAADATVGGGGDRPSRPAPGRPDPWDRRQHSGQERANSQAVLSAAGHRQPVGQFDPFQRAQRPPMERGYGLWGSP